MPSHRKTRYLKKAFLIRLALFFLPVFFAWFFISSRAIIPLAVGFNEFWFVPVYSNYDVELVQTEKQRWHVKTHLFQATKPYVHNSYQPQLRLDSSTLLELGDLKSMTLCLPLFWLILFAYKPTLKGFLAGSFYLLLLIFLMVGLNLFYQITKSLVEGGEMLRVLKSGYVFVPDRPPDWLLKVLKPLVDASFYLIVLAAPITIWLRLYWQEFHLKRQSTQTPGQ